MCNGNPGGELDESYFILSQNLYIQDINFGDKEYSTEDNQLDFGITLANYGPVDFKNLAVTVSVLVAYSTLIPFFKPMGFVASKARFLPMIGLSFVFTLLSANGYDLKIKLLVFGMSVFIVESMIKIINSVTDNEYNHARTIFGSEWKVIYERVILGKAHEMLNAVKQNFAIVWTMLTFAEGLVRSDGGVGAMMLNENKHLQLDSVFAIQMTLFFVGILIDYLFGLLRSTLFPYADLTIQKR
jgi:NitT/TauT family transport system permease protein